MKTAISTLCNFVLWLALFAFTVEPAFSFNKFVPYWYKTPTIEFMGCDDDGSNLTTYTAPVDQNIEGTVVGGLARRTVILAIGGEDSATNFSIASATMNGVAMAEIADTANVGSLVQAAIYIGDPGPTETVADFTYTFSEAIVNAAICWWVAYDLISKDTATDSAVQFSTSSGAMTLDLDVRAKGIAVGFSYTQDSGATIETDWTGLSEDADPEGAESDFSAAHTTQTADQFPLSVTADWLIGSGDTVGVTASFR